MKPKTNKTLGDVAREAYLKAPWGTTPKQTWNRVARAVVKAHRRDEAIRFPQTWKKPVKRIGGEASRLIAAWPISNRAFN